MNSYWLLQIRCGEPILFGPYESDAARVNEFDMCLIDPGTEHIVFIDPGSVTHPQKPYAWKPSWAYRQERLDYINNIQEEE